MANSFNTPLKGNKIWWKKETIPDLFPEMDNRQYPVSACLNFR